MNEPTEVNSVCHMDTDSADPHLFSVSTLACDTGIVNVQSPSSGLPNGHSCTSQNIPSETVIISQTLDLRDDSTKSCTQVNVYDEQSKELIVGKDENETIFLSCAKETSLLESENVTNQTDKVKTTMARSPARRGRLKVFQRDSKFSNMKNNESSNVEELALNISEASTQIIKTLDLNDATTPLNKVKNTITDEASEPCFMGDTQEYVDSVNNDTQEFVNHGDNDFIDKVCGADEPTQAYALGFSSSSSEEINPDETQKYEMFESDLTEEQKNDKSQTEKCSNDQADNEASEEDISDDDSDIEADSVLKSDVAELDCQDHLLSAESADDKPLLLDVKNNNDEGNESPETKEPNIEQVKETNCTSPAKPFENKVISLLSDKSPGKPLHKSALATRKGSPSPAPKQVAFAESPVEIHLEESNLVSDSRQLLNKKSHQRNISKSENICEMPEKKNKTVITSKGTEVIEDCELNVLLENQEGCSKDSALEGDSTCSKENLTIEDLCTSRTRKGRKSNIQCTPEVDKVNNKKIKLDQKTEVRPRGRPRKSALKGSVSVSGEKISENQASNIDMESTKIEPEKMNESINKPEPEKMNESINKPEPEKMNESINKPEPEKMNESINKPEPEKMNESINKPEPEKIKESINKPEPEKMSESINKPEPEKMSESSIKPSEPEQMKESINQPTSDKKTDAEIDNLNITLRKNSPSNPKLPNTEETIPTSSRRKRISNHPLYLKDFETDRPKVRKLSAGDQTERSVEKSNEISSSPKSRKSSRLSRSTVLIQPLSTDLNQAAKHLRNITDKTISAKKSKDIVQQANTTLSKQLQNISQPANTTSAKQSQNNLPAQTTSARQSQDIFQIANTTSAIQIVENVNSTSPKHSQDVILPVSTSSSRDGRSLRRQPKVSNENNSSASGKTTGNAKKGKKKLVQESERDNKKLELNCDHEVANTNTSIENINEQTKLNNSETTKQGGEFIQKSSAAEYNDKEIESQIKTKASKRKTRMSQPDPIQSTIKVSVTHVAEDKKKTKQKASSSKKCSPSPQSKVDQMISSPLLRRSSSAQKPKVMFTGLIDEPGEKIVKDLGGEIALAIHDCTHLVTDKIRRTVKFLSGLSKGLPIVSPLWLENSKQAGTFLDGHKYLVSDPSMEKQYKFTLHSSIAKAASVPLLKDYKIHVTKSVRPDAEQMQEILQCAGADYLKSIPNKVTDNTIVISCPEDKKLCQSAIKIDIKIIPL
ncbi:hypothetical protein Btru_042773 [Bulinus truncatus]|nr:hypothetical protein Btru_042773 [Bulinus truncatus]